MHKLRLQQQLKQQLTPLQLQTASLIAASSAELSKKIAEVLLENPTLTEEVEEAELSKEEHKLPLTLPEDRLFGWQQPLKIVKKEPVESADSITPYEQFVEQINYLSLTSLQKKIAHYLADNLDSQGYLPYSPALLQQELEIAENIISSVEEIEMIIEQLKQLDPAGIAARNLQESLVLQLDRLPKTSLVVWAKEVVSKGFDFLVKRDYLHLLQITSLPGKDQLQEALRLIRSLQPSPLSAAVDEQKDRVWIEVPDFKVYKEEEGDLKVMLNPALHPKLYIRRAYSEWNSNKQNKDREKETIFLRKKLQKAHLFLQAMQQRRVTLQTTMKCIVELQEDFFRTGQPRDLRPLYLKEVAKKVGLDLSTISRVVRQKKVATPWGVFALKYFFSEPIPTRSGKLVSSRFLKERLHSIIKEEPAQQPYTDGQLTDHLNKEGFRIARRTIAKYREKMGIPVASRRRRLE